MHRTRERHFTFYSNRARGYTTQRMSGMNHSERKRSTDNTEVYCKFLNSESCSYGQTVDPKREDK